ncbi:MFS transporter [Jeotgalibacillus salarius]|uniref:MFS transporter n=1 Tax=Jeotgalibacillus salarius TaxID=546023 RepID=A0A4Y8LJI7_9BACL|nr:MFS transporter [Jeotgalibacillus salarius]TFE02375.1 MFS transporter [Jeotgalibacillus salarius]
MTNLKKWKDPGVLLASTGVASIGDFIYLVAINLIVLNMTGSAAAVAGLWIVAPITNIVMKFWTGSFIDYRSKRKVMMVTYVARAGLIALIPFAPNVIIIYGILVLLSIAKAFFNPSSITYITILVPQDMRKRFNAIRSFTASGAFIVGPAVAGTLILLTSIDLTIWLNALFFVGAAWLMMLLPEKEKIEKATIPKLTVKQVKADFTVVYDFVKKASFVATVYMGFIIILLFTFAMDAQEVVFAREVVGLTELEYSLLISITGIGSIAGALLLSIMSEKLSIRVMMTTGLLMMTIGYIIYAFSWSFASIAGGFILLGFFNSFLNTGMATFYQNNVPVDMMGRVTSVFELWQSALQILFVLLLGVAADLFSLREAIITAALLMLILSCFFCVFLWKPGREAAFADES